MCLGASGKELVWISPGFEKSHNIVVAVIVEPWIPKQSNGLLCSAPTLDKLKLKGGARNSMSVFDEGEIRDLAGHLLWTAANAASLTTPSFVLTCMVNGVPY